nr:hypothetical protein [Sulfurirhabdus autotrophica]
MADRKVSHKTLLACANPDVRQRYGDALRYIFPVVFAECQSHPRRQSVE